MPGDVEGFAENVGGSGGIGKGVEEVSDAGMGAATYGFVQGRDTPQSGSMRQGAAPASRRARSIYRMVEDAGSLKVSISPSFTGGTPKCDQRGHLFSKEMSSIKIRKVVILLG